MIINPAMELRAQPEPEAVWVGELDVFAYLNRASGEGVELLGAQNYRTAKLLLRERGRVLRFLNVELHNGNVPENFREQITESLHEAEEAPLSSAPKFSVVICSRERPEDLFEALKSVLRIDYPNFEVLVIDNAPTTTRTKDMLAKYYPQVRHVVEPIAGISAARNAGIHNATGEYIAFTDDDVVVDPWWLRALLTAFQSADDITCVSGLVPSGELATKSQRYFDSRVTWSRNIESRVYRISERYSDLPAFPFSVGAYGTGANFAIRRKGALLFDVRLGTGRKTGGGEDIDYFFRLLLNKGALAVCPHAFVWHRHRASEDAVMKQALTYGSGLGAWLFKVALTPRAWVLLAPRLVAGARMMNRLGGEQAAGAEVAVDNTLDSEIRFAEKRAILKGPGLYLREVLRFN